MSDAFTANEEEPGQAVNSDLTRRLWMLRVGETALGLGFAGTGAAGTSQPASLPPGLYQPQTAHLGHALESSGRFHPIPEDSPTDYVKPSTGPFEPLFFSASEFAVIRRLTELILGEGLDTAKNGPRDVVEEVAEWVDLRGFSSAGIRAAAAALDPSHRAVMVAYYGTGDIDELGSVDAQNVYREGLAWLEGQSRAHRATEFLALEEKDQLQILAPVAGEPADKEVETTGTRFFKLLKSEIVRGFYTSQAGLKELNFRGNSFYARSPGCKMA